MRKIILILLIFTNFASLFGQDKFVLKRDDDEIIEASKVTLIKLNDQKEVLRLQQFSGLKSYVGILLFKSNLSKVLSEIEFEKKNVRKILVQWSLNTKDKTLLVEKIEILGNSDSVFDTELIKKRLSSIPYEFYTRKETDQILNFILMFDNKG
ncbi:MAG: hypothetical protein ACPGSD_11560 [Flavobacteriales bacterium]